MVKNAIVVVALANRSQHLPCQSFSRLAGIATCPATPIDDHTIRHRVVLTTGGRQGRYRMQFAFQLDITGTATSAVTAIPPAVQSWPARMLRCLPGVADKYGTFILGLV